MATASSRLNGWLLTAAVLGGLAVAFGAFGAHGLESHLSEADGTLSAEAQRKVANWETAARYQMYHALAILAIGCLGDHRHSVLLRVSGSTMTAGALLFSGCLYTYVLSGQRFLIAIVPIGGVLLLVGWGLLALAVIWRPSGDTK